MLSLALKKLASEAFAVPLVGVVNVGVGGDATSVAYTDNAPLSSPVSVSATLVVNVPLTLINVILMPSLFSTSPVAPLFACVIISPSTTIAGVLSVSVVLGPVSRILMMSFILSSTACLAPPSPSEPVALA